MQNLPSYISLIFLLTTLATIYFFYRATTHKKQFLVMILSWIIFQVAITLSGFYLKTDTLPPRMILLVLPPMMIIILMFLFKKGRLFIDNLNIGFLTILHIIRIPVELVLFWLSVYKLVPELMTYEGRNPDILSGMTAPIIYYFVFIKNKLSRKVLLTWNFVCLGLLANIVINAVLSVPSNIQQFAINQPNVAVLNFPFMLLPGCIVPLVLFSHLASIRQLLKKTAV